MVYGVGCRVIDMPLSWNMPGFLGQMPVWALCSGTAEGALGRTEHERGLGFRVWSLGFRV
jgi:hypothetical protein